MVLQRILGNLCLSSEDTSRYDLPRDLYIGFTRMARGARFLCKGPMLNSGHDLSAFLIGLMPRVAAALECLYAI